MSTARISVNVDENVKQNAQKILNEIGMDLTTAVDLLLRTIIREERIPFELKTEKAYREDIYKQYIRAELNKSKIEASNSDTQWLSQNDMMTQLKKQREGRNGL